MFGKNKKPFTTYTIRRMVEKDIYYSSPKFVDGVEKGKENRNKELKDMFVVLWNHNLSGLEEHYAQTEDHEWDKKKKDFVIRAYDTSYNYYMKAEVEALGFVPLPKGYDRFIGDLSVKYYHIYQGDYFVSPEDLEKITKAVETEQKPLVLKGTDWPYWFKVEGKLIPSTTSSWFNFLYKDRQIVTEKMLEVYKGPDKYREHENDGK